MALRKKIKLSRYCCALIICVLVFYIIIFHNLLDISSVESGGRVIERKEATARFLGPLTKDNIAERLIIIIREFEDFENSLVETVDSVNEILGKVPVLIVADHLPYPPFKLSPKSSGKIVTLNSDLTKNYSSGCLSHFVDSQYVLFLPDGVKIKTWKQLLFYINFLKSKRNTTAVAIPIAKNVIECKDFDVDLKRWTISYNVNNSDISSQCPLVTGAHALLVKTEEFKSLPEPFARPFPFSFYVQAKLKNWKIRMAKGEKLEQLKTLYLDPHNSWKHKRAETERLKSFYSSVGIKQEILPNHISRYYGCDKNTPRCFGTVVNDMPAYLYEGRWTPPCCLKALRETAAHVFSILEKSQVRYWLEGGSLLGAARHKDIIPWDYDVDVGIYRDDIIKCRELNHTETGPYVDQKGFVWEKAPEGHFYRVQYSEVNHLHVDIYPFYSKHGIMTKDSWFPTHRQDTEFPEKFLQPLTKIEFAGLSASAPNSVREFLEYKFGEGVIEQPKYPNLQNPK
ncbi:ribitol 5-phosphate transferase FKRP-like [Physella acuta]|uniref:ribitol 5-phosphate transferase FKRP-like n=1 Tax=Physella acuta TaxID=109671 RepID=UPI0027DBF8F9|nr:ribitol 5-phosphate transferase FKRP-like [Physella acuta]